MNWLFVSVNSQHYWLLGTTFFQPFPPLLNFTPATLFFRDIDNVFIFSFKYFNLCNILHLSRFLMTSHRTENVCIEIKISNIFSYNYAFACWMNISVHCQILFSQQVGSHPSSGGQTSCGSSSTYIFVRSPDIGTNIILTDVKWMNNTPH